MAQNDPEAREVVTYPGSQSSEGRKVTGLSLAALASIDQDTEATATVHTGLAAQVRKRATRILAQ